jgi:hypothetical protein
MLLLGVSERAVMGIMGWSNTAMASRYQHITAAIRRDVAQRVGGLLWTVTGTPATSHAPLRVSSAYSVAEPEAP